MSNEPLPPAVLSTSESWALLREGVVGRIAVAVGDQPEIFPVNYLVDHGSIVIRTAEGTKLLAAKGRPVAFEVDEFDPANGEAWSVVVKGTAQEVSRHYELIDSEQLPLFPWHAAAKPRVLRIEPGLVTGRRFHAMADPMHTPTVVPRRAAPE